MWSSGMWEKFGFCFSRANASIKKISNLGGKLILGYHSMTVRHSADIS